jgi:hypothetical protein
LAAVFEDHLDGLLRASTDKRFRPVDVASVADEMAAVARAQKGMPALAPLPPPVECATIPVPCPVGQAWMVRALRAEEQL